MGGQHKDRAWRKLHVQIRKHGNGSGSCPMVGFRISSAENFKFYYKDFITTA
jgi:hypothetical protein